MLPSVNIETHIASLESRRKLLRVQEFALQQKITRDIIMDSDVVR